MKKVIFSLLFLFCCGIYMYGQNNAYALKTDILNQGTATTPDVHRTCSSDERHEQMMQDPIFAKAYNDLQEHVSGQTLNKNLPACTTPIIIPVVVHFQSTNISNQCMIDATIAQLDQMNLDFAGCNANAGQFCEWIAAGCDVFGGAAGGDAQAVDGSCFQFCLADQNLPADGNLIAGGVAITTGYNANNQNAPALWNGYLNIYVGNLGGGILGFVNFLGGASNTNQTQGASVTSVSYGGAGFAGCEGIGTDGTFNNGATLTHEVGHWFGLEHTFSDNVVDTPPQNQPNYGCPTVDLNNCTSTVGTDYGGNFMDYVDDDCMFMFTEDQIMIMQATVAAQGQWATNSVSCAGTYPTCPQQGACVVACPTAVTTMLNLTNDYCGASTDTAFPDPEASGVVLDDNSDVVYSWSTGGYLSVGGTPVTAPAILTSANCSVETETYYLNADCGTTPLATPLDAGTWVITAYPGIPADITTLVTVTDGVCDEPMVVAISGCESFVTITPDAANPTFPVNAGDMGTASYTVTFVPDPAGPDCCNPPAPGGEVIVNGDFEAGAGPDWAEIEESPVGTPVSFGIVGGTGNVNGSTEGWFGGWGGDSFTSITQNITIDPACTAANLTFDYNFTACGTATLEVVIGGVVVGTLPCAVGAGTFGPVEVIGAGAPTGATTISIEVTENGGGNSNLFVDNVSLITECPVEAACDVVVTADYNCTTTGVGYCDQICFTEYNANPGPDDFVDATLCMTSVTCADNPDASCLMTDICDDGDPCTENETETTIIATGEACVACSGGTPIAQCTLPSVAQACDDGDPCTTNDMEEVDACDANIVCVPCAGTVDMASCDAACTSTAACDDGDPCTTGEMETLAADGSVCVPCGGGTAVTPACGDPAATNYDMNATCIDNTLCTYGEYCDDICFAEYTATPGPNDTPNATLCITPVGCGGDASCFTTQACDDADPCTTGEMETLAPDGSVCVPCGDGTAVTPACGDPAADNYDATATCIDNTLCTYGPCQDDIAGTITLAGCDFTGTMVTIYDSNGAVVGTAMTDAMGNYALAGPFPCGAYSAELTGAPSCYTDEGGDLGPRQFNINGDGAADGYNFAPIPANIPTVGEWGLIILGLMMSIVAIIGIRERKTAEIYS